LVASTVLAATAASTGYALADTRHLVWGSCPDGGGVIGMECTTIRVPVDWAKPTGRKITLMLGLLRADGPKPAEHWRMLERLRAEGTFATWPPREATPDNGFVQFTWWHPGWLPLAMDSAGNLYCIDLAPAERGTIGQVISWEKHAGPTGPRSRTTCATPSTGCAKANTTSTRPPDTRTAANDQPLTGRRRGLRRPARDTLSLAGSISFAGFSSNPSAGGDDTCAVQVMTKKEFPARRMRATKLSQ
jgi:hypothetical protein